MEHEQELSEFLVQSSRDLGLSLAQDQIAQFIRYLSELLRWNETINLTSIRESREIVIKHFIDSLLALATVQFPQQATVADIGTGGGFPGIPLKIARSDLKLSLVESNHKKCSFLASIVGTLRLQDVIIFRGTIQEYCQTAYPLAQIITVRALRFEEIREQVCRIMAPAGLIILYRTIRVGLNELGHEFRVQSERTFSLPDEQGQRVISVLTRA